MISVPSSSGKSLQLFLLAGKNEKMSNFSPLFIGEITSTGHVRGSRRCTAISVPSSSGRSLQPTVIFCSSLRTIISVPSSSGKSLQHVLSCCERDSHSRFQSPLHRGNHFNKLFLMRRLPAARFQSPLHRGNHFNYSSSPIKMTKYNISVPSSSGKSLQRMLTLTHGIHGHISVPSSSGKSLQRDDYEFIRYAIWNFSPLFIGEFTSTKRWAYSCHWVLNFSPLFIGEITSTSFHLTTAYTPTKFRSPLHRGNHFNCCKAMTDGAVTPISVPSSSGKSLQQRHGKR